MYRKMNEYASSPLTSPPFPVFTGAKTWHKNEGEKTVRQILSI